MAEIDGWFSPHLLALERAWQPAALTRAARLHLLRVLFEVQPQAAPPAWLAQAEAKPGPFSSAPPGLENLWAWIRPLGLDPVEELRRNVGQYPEGWHALERRRLTAIEHGTVFNHMQWRGLLDKLARLDASYGRRLLWLLPLPLRELADATTEAYIRMRFAPDPKTLQA